MGSVRLASNNVTGTFTDLARLEAVALGFSIIVGFGVVEGFGQH